jgi:hypothetical protein
MMSFTWPSPGRCRLGQALKSEIDLDLFMR